MEFISEARSFHEFHGFGRTLHVALGFGQQFVQVCCTHGLNNGVGAGKGSVVRFRGVVLGPVGQSFALFKQRALLFADLLWRKSVRFVVGHLLGPSPGGFFNGLGHAVRDLVCVHDDAAIDISGRTSGRLGQASVAAQEAFFVSVHDGHKAHLWKIQPLPEKVDPHQHVDGAVAQFT